MQPKEERAVVRVENLECGYGNDVILTEVNFSVRRREIFFVVGRSGCGKTTLLRNLLGLQTPFRGRILYFGRDLTKAEPAERRDFNRSVGVLFQSDALWTDMTLADNVALPLALHSKLSRDLRSEIVNLKLAQVGLAGWQDQFPRELSGGMQKRAALARALALDPDILFFDEPTAGLDPISANQIDQLILQARDTVGATIIVISHSLSSIFHVADRMILLDSEAKGIIADGVPSDLVQQSRDRRISEFLGQQHAGKEA